MTAAVASLPCARKPQLQLELQPVQVTRRAAHRATPRSHRSAPYEKANLELTSSVDNRGKRIGIRALLANTLRANSAEWDGGPAEVLAMDTIDVCVVGLSCIDLHQSSR